MTKAEAIAHFGSQAKLAAALKITQPTVSDWQGVPLEHQFYLEKLTAGVLKADPHPAEHT
jgi:predicted XRE-type DNA-binding protein